MAWFSCVSYYHFSLAMIYAPRLKDFVHSLGGLLVVLFCFFLRKKSHFEEAVHIEIWERQAC